MHRAADHFPRDAQDIADEDGLRYGLERGWAPLCKDGRIKGRDVERAPLVEFGACLFYLDNQRLLRAEMIARWHAARPAIHRAVAAGGPAAYAVGDGGHLRRTWP